MANLSALGLHRQAYLKQQQWARASVLALVGGICAASGWVALFTSGLVTLEGVPYSVWRRIWQDSTARQAYLAGDRSTLHNRLSDLSIKYEIKQYYRPRIPDPVQLDQYIHQVLYDHIDYLGEDYTVEAGQLKLKTGRAADIVACPNC